MKKNYKKTYYQPCDYSDNGTDIRWGEIPEGLFSFQVFLTQNEAEMWLEEHGYDVERFAILEYHDDDIEDATVIDRYGDIIEN